MTDDIVVFPAHWYDSLPLPSVAGEVDSDLAVLLRSYIGTHALMEKPALCDNVICVHQGGAKRVHRWQAGTHQIWDVQQDGVSLMPRLCANRWWTEGPIAFTHVTLSGDLLARTAREEFDRDPNDITLLDRVGLTDPLIAQLITTLSDTMRSATPSRLFTESLLTALIIRVLVQHSSMSKPPAPSLARGGLAGWQLRRVADFLVAHLAEDVSAAELTKLVGLSRAQFFRAFRQSTGQTPGRYQLALRLERARHLLTEKSCSIETVARSVGFSDVDSFARAFRRLEGLTPGAWRRRHFQPKTDSETPED